jgi:hypothetical protein
VKSISFSAWLVESLLLISRAPVVWVGYTVFIGMVLAVGRISLALGVLSSVTFLFVGVGVAKYIDLKTSEDHSVGFFWAINKSLPLALLAAVSIMLCWFVFRVVANIYAGELYKIVQFFYYWEYTPENIEDKSLRQLAGWVYSSALAALIFMVLMLTSFASWFSYPLMLFKDYSWSQAKTQGNKAITKHQNVMIKLMAFIFIAVFIGGGTLPLLTPVLYTLVSTLMYVSYKAIFESLSI